MASNGISARGKADKGSRAPDTEALCRRELDEQREEFSRELVRKAYMIARLERELGEVRQIYEGSLSWRLTSPLRAFKALLARRPG